MANIVTLLAALEPKFQEHGYKLKNKRERRFIKTETNGDVVAISVDLTVWRANSWKTPYINCLVRIDALEQVYLKYYAHLSDKERKNHFTFGKLCSYLFPPDSPLNASLNVNEDTIDDVTRLVWDGIVGYVFPFAARYSDQDNLVRNLSSEDPNERITSDQYARHVVPMADAALKNDRERVEKYGEAFLAFSTRYGTVDHDRAEAVYRGILRDYFGEG